MADQEVKIRISTDASGAVAGFEKVNSGMKKMESGMSGLTSKIKQNWLGLSAAIGAFAVSASKAWNLAEGAASYIEQMQNLDGLAAAYGTTATKITDEIQSIGDGMISMATAAEVAYSGMVKNLKPDMLYGLARAATVLSDSMGMTADEAFKSMSSALELNKQKSLKLAVGTIDLKDRYGDLADKMTEAEKQAAFYNLIIEKTNEIQGRLGNSTKSIADQMETLMVTANNVKIVFGMGLIRVGAGVIGIFQSLAAAVLTVTSVFPKLLQYMALANAKIFEWTGQTDRMKAYREEAKSLGQAADNMLGASVELAGKSQNNFSVLFSTTEELTKSQGKAGKAMGALGSAAKGLDSDAKSLIKSWKELEISLNGKIASAGLTDFEKELQKINTDTEKLIEKYNKLPASMRAGAISKINQSKESDIGDLTTKFAQEDVSAIWEQEKIVREYGKKLVEDAKKTSEERLTAERDMYQDIRGYEDSYYNASLSLIDSQAKKYRELKIDEVAVTAWAEEEKRKATLQLDRTTSGGSYDKGWKQGAQDWAKGVGNMFTAGEKMAKSTADSMSNSFSSIFFDAAKGELKDFSSYFKSFSDSILKAFTDMLADMAAKWAMESIFGSKSGTGGQSGIGGLLGSGLSMVGSALGSTGLFGTSSEYGYANGAAFSGGRVTAFANGGIVSRPMLFPMANGMGLMGEAGPEAVMPLKRTSSGKLGVVTEGTGGLTLNVPINISGPSSKAMISEMRSEIEETAIRVLRRHS